MLKENFVYFKNENDSKIAAVPNFINTNLSTQIINSSELLESWESVGFYNVKTLMNTSFTNSTTLSTDFKVIVDSIKNKTQELFNKDIVLKTVYIQKWPVGSYGVKHNDTHNNDGTIGNIDYKISTILFLHSDFVGGNIEFPDQNIIIEPNKGSLYIFDGGQNNEHQVSKIESGLRYTIIGFWDFENSVYTEHELAMKLKSQEKWLKYINKDNNESN